MSPFWTLLCNSLCFGGHFVSDCDLISLFHKLTKN